MPCDFVHFSSSSAGTFVFLPFFPSFIRCRVVIIAALLEIMSKLQAANDDLQNQLADAKAEADAAKAAADANKDKGNQVDLTPVSKAQKIVIEG